jgi:hypothetical protein
VQERCADEQEDREQLPHGHDVDEVRAGPDADVVDRTEREDDGHDDGPVRGVTLEADHRAELRRVGSEADEGVQVAGPADDEPHVPTERVARVEVWAAVLALAARELREAERDRDQHQGAQQVRQRRETAHRALHVVGLRKHARADDGVDADRQHVEQAQPSPRAYHARGHRADGLLRQQRDARAPRRAHHSAQGQIALLVGSTSPGHAVALHEPLLSQ